jgi:hypothetical protein
VIVSGNKETKSRVVLPILRGLCRRAEHSECRDEKHRPQSSPARDQVEPRAAESKPSAADELTAGRFYRQITVSAAFIETFARELGPCADCQAPLHDVAAWCVRRLPGLWQTCSRSRDVNPRTGRKRVKRRGGNQKVNDGLLLLRRSFPSRCRWRLCAHPQSPTGPELFFCEPFGGVMMTSLSSALRGLLVTTTAAGIRG